MRRCRKGWTPISPTEILHSRSESQEPALKLSTDPIVEGSTAQQLEQSAARWEEQQQG